MNERESILVVEDDDQVRRALCVVLQAEGYRVIVASSAHGALIEARRHPIDLILVDVILPAMGGRVLVERLRQAGHRTKVLFMSGHPDVVVQAQGVVEPGDVLIHKPFSPRVLVEAVARALRRDLVR